MPILLDSVVPMSRQQSQLCNECVVLSGNNLGGAHETRDKPLAEKKLCGCHSLDLIIIYN